jgi:hypothetical protein
MEWKPPYELAVMAALKIGVGSKAPVTGPVSVGPDINPTEPGPTFRYIARAGVAAGTKKIEKFKEGNETVVPSLSLKVNGQAARLREKKIDRFPTPL